MLHNNPEKKELSRSEVILSVVETFRLFIENSFDNPDICQKSNILIRDFFSGKKIDLDIFQEEIQDACNINQVKLYSNVCYRIMAIHILDKYQVSNDALMEFIDKLNGVLHENKPLNPVSPEGKMTPFYYFNANFKFILNLEGVKQININSMKKGNMHPKICPGAAINNTFLMFGENKKFFLRDIKVYMEGNSLTILASKIARIISKENFSSEKWLSNGKTVSQSIPESASPHPLISRLPILFESMSNPDCKSKIELENNKLNRYNSYINTKNHIKGLGTIDEVCAFIQEGDPNIENIMFLGEAFDEDSIAIKIDFNYCRFNASYNFEVNDLVPDKHAIYGKQIYNSSYPEQYKIERSLARLKLSLFSDLFIQNILNVYCPVVIRENFCNILKLRRDKFTDELNSETYGIHLVNTSSIENEIDILSKELVDYSKKHFSTSSNEIEKSLNERKELIKTFSNQKLSHIKRNSYIQV